MDGGALDHPLEAGGRQRLARCLGDDALKTVVDEGLEIVPQAIDIARRTQRIVKQNLVWAATYNLIALPLAALGYVPPWLAAIGMSASSIVVVLNALRLNPKKALRDWR